MRLLPKDTDLGWTPYAWLVYLGFLVVTPFLRAQPNGRELAAVAAAIVIFLVLYFRAHWLSGTSVLWPIAAMVALGLGFLPWNLGASAFFIYAASFCASVNNSRLAVRLIVLIELIVLASALVLKLSFFQAIWPLVFVPLVGGINVHYAQVRRANSRLRLAQDEIEHLAKVAERERIARDLHDLLGHTLSLITIKSELASRLADRDVKRAIAEIRDVERISREALAQVRDAVRGYRSEGLQQELAASRRMLDAANIHATFDVVSPVLTAQQEAILSLALREAVTNVVRHSSAKHVTIALNSNEKRIALAVADDGTGKHRADGSGLNGMRERIDSLGGTLSVETNGGTVLTVALPVPSHGAAERTA